MIPPILIVTDRGHLVVYKATENHSLERIDHAEFEEGNKKISDIVTDQSGAFGNSGTPGTGTHESMPMVAELEVRSFRKIGQKIREVLDRENPRWWGFSAPSEINNAILDGLEDKYRDRLSRNLKVDLANSRPSDVLARFEKAAIV
jgi:hypothetical protein